MFYCRSINCNGKGQQAVTYDTARKSKFSLLEIGSGGRPKYIRELAKRGRRRLRGLKNKNSRHSYHYETILCRFALKMFMPLNINEVE